MSSAADTFNFKGLTEPAIAKADPPAQIGELFDLHRAGRPSLVDIAYAGTDQLIHTDLSSELHHTPHLFHGDFIV
jgi:hypothetical protein